MKRYVKLDSTGCIKQISYKEIPDFILLDNRFINADVGDRIDIKEVKIEKGTKESEILSISIYQLIYYLTINDQLGKFEKALKDLPDEDKQLRLKIRMRYGPFIMKKDDLLYSFIEENLAINMISLLNEASQIQF